MALSPAFLRFSQLWLRQSKWISLWTKSMNLSPTWSLTLSSSLRIPQLLFFSSFSFLSFREAISKRCKMTPCWLCSLVHGKQSYILHLHRLCLLTTAPPCVLLQSRKSPQLCPIYYSIYFPGKSQKLDHCIPKLPGHTSSSPHGSDWGTPHASLLLGSGG